MLVPGRAIFISSILSSIQQSLITFYIIVGLSDLDVMQRLKRLSHQIYTQQNSHFNQAFLEKKSALAHALEPTLSDLTRQLIKKQYRKILPKVEQARRQVKLSLRSLNLLKQNYEISESQWQKYLGLLREKLHEILSELLNEMADKLSEKLVEVSEDNLIVRAIRVYSSVMGSYQNNLTFLQRVVPNMRTLSYLQNQIMHYSGDNREFSSSIWVLLYIFSFAFVQMFGKYITRPEKEAVNLVIKEAFLRNIISIGCSLKKKEGKVNEQESRKQIDMWIQEIANSIS